MRYTQSYRRAFFVPKKRKSGLMIRLCFIVFALMAALCLSACDASPPEKAAAFEKPLYRWGAVKGRTVTIWGNRDDLNRPYMRRAFSRYAELTGNTVRTESFSHRELAERLSAAFAAGGEDGPDILLSFGGVNIEPLDPDRNFYDFTAAPWVDDLTDTAINQAIYHGKVIGLPYWEASISGILYNKALFRRYGIAVPQTQKEFLDACESLLRKGITPVYLPFAERTMLLYQFPMDSLFRDPCLLGALNEGRLSYAELPQMRAIVEWYRTMSERGYFGLDYESNGWAGMDAAMREERHAMMICWDTWLYTDFSGDPSRFGLMPAFMGVPEGGSFEGPNLALLIVNRHGPHVDAALDLIAFMADPYNYNVAFEGVYTAPVFKKQIGSTATPQYTENERRIERLYLDSTAWLRIRGFSQLDAAFIQRHMRDPDYDVLRCLKDMDAARTSRAAKNRPKAGPESEVAPRAQ